MALYDTRFGLPQSVADYLNQGLPDIYQSIYNPPPATIGPITTMPVESTPLVDSLYPQTGGNAEGFSVYNPDPNMTRTSKNYNPRPAYEAAFGTMMGDPVANIATGALNKFDVMGPYQQKPPSKIQELLSNTMLGRGIKGIGSFAKNLLSGLPPNRAGIFQNELLGGGFMLDNMGRLVTNNYNTPTGIMAGYNPVSGGLLNMLTGGKKGEPATYGLDKAYDKRRETVAKALEKMGMSKEDIKAAIAGEYEGDAPINPITGKPTTLINRLDLFNQSQNLFNKRKKAADVIFDRKIEERREEKQRAAAEEAAKAREAEARRITNTYQQQQQQQRDSGGGSRRGDADISGPRGGFATDDTAGFF